MVVVVVFGLVDVDNVQRLELTVIFHSVYCAIYELLLIIRQGRPMSTDKTLKNMIHSKHFATERAVV